MKLKPCPFCGDPLAAVVPHEYGYAVFCVPCQALGPLATEKQVAIEAWNNRVNSEYWDTCVNCGRPAEPDGLCDLCGVKLMEELEG